MYYLCLCKDKIKIQHYKNLSKMKTQKIHKISGFWADENLGIRIIAAIYYVPATTKDLYNFQCLKEKILKEKHQYFELKENVLLELPYRPQNVIKFRYIFK